MLSRGSSGTDVYNMQAELLALGYDVGPLDGQFGPKTEAAVRAFQSHQGIQSDGVVGPQTIGQFAAASRPPPGAPASAAAPAVAAPAGPAPTSIVPTATGPTQPQRDAYSYMQNLFTSYGMTDLSDWLWGQITSGAGTDQIMLALTQTPTYQKRFAGNAARQAAGFEQLSPASYLSTEAQYRAELRAAGLTAPNDPNYYTNLFSQDVSPSELASRLKVYHTVATTFTPYMRQAFEQHANMHITADDVYNMFQGQNQDLVNTYAVKTGTEPATQGRLDQWLQQAQDDEKALFHHLSREAKEPAMVAQAPSTKTF
jgi:peptidoglycan hydrolase-like protein with peptidoglycan-binding domain